MEGFFISIYPIVGFIGYKEYDEYFLEIGLGINTGYKWIFKNGITMQLGGGIGKAWNIKSQYENDFRYSSDGRILFDFVDVIFDFKIGYSF